MVTPFVSLARPMSLFKSFTALEICVLANHLKNIFQNIDMVSGAFSVERSSCGV